jgi:hypothetical protein
LKLTSPQKASRHGTGDVLIEVQARVTHAESACDRTRRRIFRFRDQRVDFGTIVEVVQ